MKVILFFLLLILSTQSFAQNEVQKLLNQKSGLTPFVILAEFHSRDDGVAAAPGDINTMNLDSNTTAIVYNHCATAVEHSPVPISDSKLFLYQQTFVIPGTPPNGPLFPGTPDETVNRMSLTAYPDDVATTGSNNLQDFLSHAHWQSSGNSTTFDNDSSTNYVQLNYYNSAVIRKHGDLLSYYMVHRDGGAEEARTYGYCWNE
ncbi:MAG: hypothetical protein H7281_05160 [Bacteriovorax sp.]|nr:hypothetical protein [Bacteriovorax sp.]